MENLELQGLEELSLEIPIQRTKRFFETAKALSEFIKALPLSNADNDRLIQMMIDHITEAEKAPLNRASTWAGSLPSISRRMKKPNSNTPKSGGRFLALFVSVSSTRDELTKKHNISWMKKRLNLGENQG